jgi:hypothetical protein
MEKKTITKSSLVLASLGVMGIAYTPVQKNNPTRDFVESTYLVKTPKGLMKSNRLSEQRREILKNIAGIRKEIRLTHHESQAIDKVCNDCFQGITERSNKRISQLQLQRAQELRVPVKYVKVEVVAQRKGIMIIDNFEI